MAAPWRGEIERSLSGDSATSRFMQLATVTANGWPANRTVVFRGFLPGSDALTFVTDARSQKVAHAAADPHCEVCWYFSETRVQFRIAGRLQVISESESEEKLLRYRRDAWDALSDKTKQQFYWPEPRTLRQAEKASEEISRDTQKVPESFCLCLLQPEFVDYLDLNEWPHRRTLFSRQHSGKWTRQEVNP